MAKSTGINKSHLFRLYERISWWQATAEKKLAARIARMLYDESDNPLRRKINRPGGRSRQDKWILQAELFNELLRWIRSFPPEASCPHSTEALYAGVRDFLIAARRAWGEVWGNPAFMVTKLAAIKFMLRICSDAAARDAEAAKLRVERRTDRLAP